MCIFAVANIVAACSEPISSQTEDSSPPSFERVGQAILPDGTLDLAPYSKLAPWPHTDGNFLYSGCYVHAPLTDTPAADRCFMVIDASEPKRPVRRVTIHPFDPEQSPPPPPQHRVWADDYPFPNLPVASPCQVDWDDPEISEAVTAPHCWDPGWNTQTHYVAASPARLLAVNLERFRYGTDRQANLHGVRIYDIENPLTPVLRSQWDAPTSPPDPVTGVSPDSRGVHHFNFHGDLLFLGAEYAGFVGRILVILDLGDPESPVQLGKWWLPGQRTPEEDHLRDWVQRPLFSRPVVELEPGLWSRYVGMHYVTVADDIAYLAYHQAGLVILDVTDPAAPELLSWTDYLNPDAGLSPANARECQRAAGRDRAACGNSHTARRIPGTSLLMVEDEYFTCPFGHVRIFDVADPKAPKIRGELLLDESVDCDPAEPMRARTPERFPMRGPSAHLGNAWNNTVYLTAWYGSGVQAIDYSDPARPTVIGSYTYRISDELASSNIRYAGADTYDIIIGPGNLLYVADGHAGLRVLRLDGAGDHRR